jgi:hypothetical protein
MNLPSVIKALDPDIQLRKHTATIHFKGSLSTVSHKLLNILYKCAFDTDNFSSEEYYIRVSDIVSLIGWQKGKFDDLKDAFINLRDSGFYWNIFRQDRKNKDDWDIFGGSGFIADFMISKYDEVASFSLPSRLRKLLKNPNIYAFIDLKVQKNLKGKYDLIYYEYFLDELYRNCQKELITRWYSISDIRRMLNIPEDVYKEFKLLNHHCIKEPISTINEHTNINVVISDVYRIQRKITALQFKVSFKDPQTMSQCSLDLEDTSYFSIPQYDILKELASFFGEQQAAKILEEVSVDHPDCFAELIQRNIEYSKRQNKKGSVLSLPAFMRKAIQEDYAQYKKSIKEIKVQEEKIAEENKIIEKNLKEDFEEQIAYTKMLDDFNSLPTDKKNSVISACKSFNPLFDELPDNRKIVTAAEYYSVNKSLFN